MNMKYSVIVPAYNARTDILSIVAWWEAVREKRVDIELIIIDDGSTDGTYDMLMAHKCVGITVHRQGNQGVSAARNRGLSLARAEFVLFLDADDEYALNIFDVLDQSMMDDVDLYAFNYSITGVKMNLNVGAYLLSTTEIIQRFIQRQLSLCICALCFRRTIFQNDVTFPEQYHFGEDVYMILKILLTSSSSVRYIPDVLFNYRLDQSKTVRSPVDVNKISVLDLYAQLFAQCSASSEMMTLIQYFRQRTYLYLLKLCVKNGVAHDAVWPMLLAQSRILKDNVFGQIPIDFQCARWLILTCPRFVIGCIRVHAFLFNKNSPMHRVKGR